MKGIILDGWLYESRVNENIIGAPKMRNKFGAINIALFPY